MLDKYSYFVHKKCGRKYKYLQTLQFSGVDLPQATLAAMYSQDFMVLTYILKVWHSIYCEYLTALLDNRD